MAFPDPSMMMAEDPGMAAPAPPPHPTEIIVQQIMELLGQLVAEKDAELMEQGDRVMMAVQAAIRSANSEPLGGFAEGALV